MPAAPTFREALKKILTPKEQEEAIYAFDVLGSLAVLEIPKSLQKKKTKIAQALLKSQKNITRVYEKVGEHAGKYRIEKIRWLAGEKNPIAIHKEWGCEFALNLNYMFFNNRLGTERQRVAQMIKPKQSVCVFFAGVGPYPIEIAKHCKPSRVLAIEWNPDAIPFLEENVWRNKVNSIVVPMKGDVGKLPPIPEFDHVVMPAPESAVEYVSKATEWISPRGGIIHLYTFIPRDAEAALHSDMISRLQSLKRDWKVSFIRKVSDFSAGKIQVCMGIQVGPTKSKLNPKIKKTKPKKSIKSESKSKSKTKPKTKSPKRRKRA